MNKIMNKYIIIDFDSMIVFRNGVGVIKYFDTEQEAIDYCGIYELNDVFILKLIHHYIES
jgi:hypothetical protein